MSTSNSCGLEQQLHMVNSTQIKVIGTCDHFINKLSGYL